MKDTSVNHPQDESASGTPVVRDAIGGLSHLELAQKALDIAGVILIALDPEGNVTFLNRKGQEILEYSDGELIGKNWAKTCLLEQERSGVAATLRELRASEAESVGHFENWVVTRSGRRILVAWYNTVLTDASGQCMGTLSSGEDITERRQAEDAIRREKAFSDAIIDSLPGPFYVLNERGRFVRWNRVQEELLGVPPEKIPKMPALSTVHNEDRRAVMLATAKTFREGCATVETRQRATGRMYVFTGTRMDVGGESFMVGTGFDITERKQAEQTLRESEERFRCVVETSPDAILLMDLHGRLLMANRQTMKLTGYDSAEDFAAHVRGHQDLLAPEHRARAVHELRKIIVRGEPGAFEADIMRRDGSRWPGEMCSSLLRDSEGRPTGTIIVARDISDRKEAEKRQARSLRRLEGVNRLQEDLLLPGPLDRKFARITEAAVELLDLDFCRIWTLQPGDLCDSGCIHASASDPRHACICRDRCLHLSASAGHVGRNDGRHGRIPMGCYRIGRVADGQDRKFLVNGIANDLRETGQQRTTDLGPASFAGYRLHDTHGEPIGVLAVFAKHVLLEEDDAFLSNLAEITSRVILDSQARKELEETRRHAIAASRAKSEFLANMSHEIRTPMTAIMGFTDLLMNQSLSTEECREFLATIERNGKSLLVLINDILDLSKIEADRMTLESVNYPLRQIVDDVVDLTRLRAEEKGLRFDVSYEGPVPEAICTDPTRLRQILVNLVGNAIKFTEQGGIRLIVRRVPSQDGPVTMQFAVEDTGIGIADENLAVLFQPFAQADTSTTRRFGGTGLGLAISKRLANLLGGDIDVISKLHYGSTFTLTINASRLAQSPIPVRVAGPKSVDDLAAVAHGRILVAEDSVDLQRLLQHVLERLKLDVDIAENGRQACEMSVRSRLAGHPYDLILMDMQMPEMDGLQATRWLRERGWSGPIIALTAHAMSEHREECFAAGCTNYVAKPIQAADLRSVVARYLRRRSNSELAGGAPIALPTPQGGAPERTSSQVPHST